jgi:hypothetical protein
VGGVGVRTSGGVAATRAVALLLASCGGDGEEAAAPAAKTTITASSSTPPPTDDGAAPPAPGNGDGTGPGNGEQLPSGDVPAPGTTFTGENISVEHAAELQEEVDEGHEPWRAGATATHWSMSKIKWHTPHAPRGSAIRGDELLETRSQP